MDKAIKRNELDQMYLIKAKVYSWFSLFLVIMSYNVMVNTDWSSKYWTTAPRGNTELGS